MLRIQLARLNVHQLQLLLDHAIQLIRSMQLVFANVCLLKCEFFEECHFRLLEYPKLGRCSMEIIKDLDKMVIDLLQLFAKSCGNRLPNKIVFYRDGVDDGQYQKVLDNEVAKIKQAFRSKEISSKEQ